MRKSGKPLHSVAVIQALFIILITFSFAVSSSLEQSLYHYYAGARSFPDGIAYFCDRSQNGYILFDYPPPPGHYSSCSGGTSSRFYGTEPAALSLNVSHVSFYPVYKTQSILILSNVATSPGQNNVTFPLEAYGESPLLDPMLIGDLLSGSLPSNQTNTYEASVTDYVAGLYGLHLGDKFRVDGVSVDFNPNAAIHPTVFSKQVVIVGILAQSEVDKSFNLQGIPIFSASDFRMTAVSLGAATAGYYSCVTAPLYTFSNLTQRVWFPPLQDYCHVWPKHFAIFSQNLLQDLYGYSQLAPSEILFSFTVVPPGPSQLFSTLNSINSELTSSKADLYSISLLWRSNIAFTDNSGDYYFFRDGAQIARSSPTLSCSVPGCYFDTGVQISPILEELRIIENQTQLLTLLAFLLAITTEIAVFLLSKKKLLKEVEVYKACGLSSWRATELLAKHHLAFPARVIIASVGVTVVIGLVVGSVPLLPLFLAGTFLALVLLELTILTMGSFSQVEFRKPFTEKVG